MNNQFFFLFLANFFPLLSQSLFAKSLATSYQKRATLRLTKSEIELALSNILIVHKNKKQYIRYLLPLAVSHSFFFFSLCRYRSSFAHFTLNCTHILAIVWPADEVIAWKSTNAKHNANGRVHSFNPDNLWFLHFFWNARRTMHNAQRTISLQAHLQFIVA